MLTQWFPNLSIPAIFSAEIIFIAFSMLIAVIIWLEGQALKITKGKMPKSKFFHIGSALDTFWFFVAAFGLYSLDFQSIEKSVPVMYIIYTVGGWIYGTSLMSEQGLPDSPNDLVIPPKYIAYSQSFSLAFFVLCAVVIYLKLSGTCLPFGLPFMQ